MFKRRLKQSIRKLQLYAKYYSFLPARKKNTRYLIFMLNNTMRHGGLLDRIKGIITAKIIADVIGYELKVLVDKKSFNLFKFLIPVNSSLEATGNDISYNAFNSEPVLLYNLTKVTKKEILHLLRKKKDQYHFYCNLDLLKQFYPNETQEALNALWRNTFNQLFYFDSYFENYAKEVFKGKQNICGIHLRFLSSLGDFTEVVNNELPENEKQALISQCTRQITAIIEAGLYEKYLVVSDSVIFLQTLNEIMQNSSYAEKVIILGGAIAHIDQDHSEDVLQKTILDFYLLSQCSFVYQVLGNKMYRSQFCRYAAVLGNATYQVDKI